MRTTAPEPKGWTWARPLPMRGLLESQAPGPALEPLLWGPLKLSFLSHTPLGALPAV